MRVQSKMFLKGYINVFVLIRYFILNKSIITENGSNVNVVLYWQFKVCSQATDDINVNKDEFKDRLVLLNPLDLKCHFRSVYIK